MTDRWLVMGLGNPGSRYERTRHNIGQMAVDEIVARRGDSWKQHKAGARVAETWLRPGGPKLVLAKSNGYMNTSGGPASALAKFFQIPPERVIVVHDDLDLPFDSLKLKSGGGHGGHNGIRDIAKALGTPDFVRVRVGIGRPPGRQDPADWVLGEFAGPERANLPILVADAADAAELVVDAGLVAAQQKVHAPRP
ncbi:aminoacyl-tRNA hydrolase [Microbacterium karelineae]|uniref:aminoacyl-tRNA hydrolase n=1 Tax=Microbacterium karelineae TaxID=2654283 RepID=UPI0012EA0D65|nr:aminoacyl-tRNA hydrolase [Microbacterium karelineae]